MLKQADDFYKESLVLYKLLEKLSDKELRTVTQFKNWTFSDVIRHLHVWNYIVMLSLQEKKEYKILVDKVKLELAKGKSLNYFEKKEFEGLKGKKLLNTWKKYCFKTKELFKNEDPKKRINWIGPDMSIISAISARHMETWAHAQSIYDELGIIKNSSDSIINIAIMGNNTFKWSFQVNNIMVPDEIPHLILKSPSGQVWKFNNYKNNNQIEGLAEDFCKVVTQVRNIKDVDLKVKGEIAKKWMQIAQCFAGKPEVPPKAGTRKTKIILPNS